MAFLTIPGNVKQGSVPFSLNPKQGVNGEYVATETIKGPCNFFSFKPRFSGGQHTLGVINTFPSSLKQYISEDISYKVLYDHSISTLPSPTITWATLMKTVPSIQIREFLPDSKMDQIFNFFNSFMSGFSLWDTEKTESTGDGVNSKSVADKFKEMTSKNQIDKYKKLIDLLISKDRDDTSIILALKDLMKQVPYGETVNLGDGYQNYLMNFPFIMYNKMMGATTTNIYELPFNPQQLYNTNGSAGWESDTFNLLGNFSDSIVGKFLNNITSSIKIHQSPIWRPTDSTEGDTVEVVFQLFNDFSSDSEDSALINFIMVNTMVPNNMWAQYHVYQHSPDLYDIKIAGIKRLYMCACDITVDPKGVLRIPSDSMLQRLAGKYLNPKFKGAIKAQLLRDNNMIRIPDVYEIKMVFKSLLPNNFNNYLFSYSDSNNIYTQITKDNIHTNSIYTEATDKISTNFTNAMKEAFPNLFTQENAAQQTK